MSELSEAAQLIIYLAWMGMVVFLAMWIAKFHA